MQPILENIQRSPFYFLIWVALWIFLMELLIMLVFPLFPKLPEVTEAFIDASSLSLLITPALYFFVYQPLVKEIQERKYIEQELRQAQTKLHQHTQKLEQLLIDLSQMQLQIVQSEKMSALGNLVAGIAHEINNPIGFLAGNIQPALDYVQDLFGLIDLYQEKFPKPGYEIENEITAIDLEYLREDLPKLVASMQEGVNRILGVSTSLRIFSRADSERPVCFNIHEGLDSTLLILRHRLKANESRPEIEVIKEYEQLPLIECYVGQINQVFMNLLANAIDALEESNQGRCIEVIKMNPNCITIKTALISNREDQQLVMIQIKDNGTGMTDEVKQKIFNHLFTTKAIGKGTGLGLTIARQILVENHQGTLEVNSELGQGTEFLITLPVKA
ncbi:HAMP domain-containing histidine kinase [Nostoc muscorum FACHB-395]|nr:HAMP domain-containing histidine kinase [Desmonostoc muscorum FACHB-395]